MSRLKSSIHGFSNTTATRHPISVSRCARPSGSFTAVALAVRSRGHLVRSLVQHFVTDGSAKLRRGRAYGYGTFDQAPTVRRPGIVGGSVHDDVEHTHRSSRKRHVLLPPQWNPSPFEVVTASVESCSRCRYRRIPILVTRARHEAVGRPPRRRRSTANTGYLDTQRFFERVGLRRVGITVPVARFKLLIPLAGILGLAEAGQVYE